MIIFSEDEFCKYNENNTKAVSEPKEIFPFASVSHHHGTIVTLWTQVLVFNFKMYLNFCTFRSYRNQCLHKRNVKLATFLLVSLNTWIVKGSKWGESLAILYIIITYNWWILYPYKHCIETSVSIVRLYLQCKMFRIHMQPN